LKDVSHRDLKEQETTMQNVSHKIYSFEGFILDLERACLKLDGQEIKLRPKSFESLKYLIENRGRLVTKDELMGAVWPDSFVTDDSLVQCVRDIRRSLGDNSQHFIKTVPRRGYIFEAEVIENGSGTQGTVHTELAGGSSLVARAEKPAVERNHTSPDQLTPVSQPWTQRLWRWTGAAVLIAIAGCVGSYFWPKNAPPLSRPVPLTSYPDFELNPALSPDGNQVAFTWSGETQDNYDIYIKLIGSSPPMRLTTNPAEDASPAWSPDGRTIAFLRRFGGDRNELLLIPALGGSEHKLAEIRTQTPNDLQLPSLTWSPDGRSLVVSHCEGDDLAEGLFLISARSGEKRRLTQPPQGFRGDFTPTFSPDGRTLAFSRRLGTTASDVYLLLLSEPLGEARRLTRHDLWAANPVWTRDGHYILYVFAPISNGASELRMIAVSGSGGFKQVPLLEENIHELSLGRHLVYSRRTIETNIWRAEVPPLGDPPAAPQLLVSSTRQDFQPRYSPDGKKIAFGSTRSGTRELWVADADGSSPIQLTSFAGPLVGFMNWSPDGQRLVFHARPKGQAELFTISAAGGVPKQLTMDPSDDSMPSYSHDGRWIYFASKRSGQFEVWKMPAEGGGATQVTHSEGALMPIETPNGRTLYYAHTRPEVGISIWRMPVEGGDAEQVTGPLSEQIAFAITHNGIFYSAASVSRSQHLIRFLSFSTGRSQPVVVTDRPIGLGLSVSPDERFLVFAQRDQTGSDLMLIENFVVP
jgi:Tol biopolymer transport system component/DNA-binding winged helix-turn-helix (wHTH) protein